MTGNVFNKGSIDLKQMKNIFEHDRTRTCNPQIRSLVPYPLGHMNSLLEKNENRLSISKLFRTMLQYLFILIFSFNLKQYS